MSHPSGTSRLHSQIPIEWVDQATENDWTATPIVYRFKERWGLVRRISGFDPPNSSLDENTFILPSFGILFKIVSFLNTFSANKVPDGICENKDLPKKGRETRKKAESRINQIIQVHITDDRSSCTDEETALD